MNRSNGSMAQSTVRMCERVCVRVEWSGVEYERAKMLHNYVYLYSIDEQTSCANEHAVARAHTNSSSVHITFLLMLLLLLARSLLSCPCLSHSHSHSRESLSQHTCACFFLSYLESIIERARVCRHKYHYY